MRTLIVATTNEPFGHMEAVLRARGHEIAFSSPPHRELDESLVDFTLVFVDLRAGVARAVDICRKITAPDDGGPLVSIFGAPASVGDLESLYAAGAHVMLPVDDSLVELRVPTFEKAAERRARFAAVVRELRASHAQASSILESLQEGLIVQDASGEVIATNSSARRLLRLSEDGVTTRRWRGPDWTVAREDGTIVLPHDLPSITTLRTGQRVRGMVLGMTPPDGDTIWISVNSEPVFADDSGKPTSAVTTMSDISERRAAEDRTRSLLDGFGDGVIVHRERKIIWLNRRWMELVGITDRSVLINTSLFDSVRDDRRQLIEERLLATERGEPMPRLEQKITRADGTESVLATHTLPIMFDGKPSLLTYARDVTEQRTLEHKLVASDRLVALGRLAAGVGHEINNPLSFVIGNVERALSEIERGGTASAIQCLQEALEGAARVKNIVGDLKLFSAGNAETRAKVDLRPVIDSCLRMVDSEIRPHARVVRNLGEHPLAFVNEARVAQVLLNLFVNSAHAIADANREAPRAADKNTITVTTRFEAPNVIVTVEDTGAGISEENLVHVFDPFFTTKTDGRGTGLGLSISRMLIEAQQGSIAITSKVGEGTRVTVSLPAAADAIADPPVKKAYPSVRSMPAVSPTARVRKRVLVVDDELPLARLIKGFISHHDVTLAHSGREALACIDKDLPFDLILCDLMMPNLTGMDLYDELCARKTGLDRKMLFMTGGAFTTRARKFLEDLAADGAHGVGAVRCVEKPFRIDELVALIDARLS